MPKSKCEVEGNKAHASISDYLLSLGNVSRTGGPKGNKDGKSFDHVSVFTFKDKIANLEVSLVTVTSSDGDECMNATKLNLNSYEDTLKFEDIGVYIPDGLYFDTTTNILSGSDLDVKKGTACIRSIITEIYPLAAFVVTQKPYSHVLHFRYTGNVLSDGRLDYSVNIQSKAQVGLFKQGLEMLRSAKSMLPLAGDSVGINREVTVAAVDGGFILRMGKVVFPLIKDISGLTSKLETFYASGRLDTCFPSEMERVVNRMIIIHDGSVASL